MTTVKLHKWMNKSLTRYDADANCMRRMATMELEEKKSFLKKFKDGVCRQSSAYMYGENYQFNLKIQIRVTFGPPGS